MHDGILHIPVLAVAFGDWEFTGEFTALDLIAATTFALSGALLARRPDHYKNFTVVGILLMAVLGGLGGGVTRDVILNRVPVAFTNPAYLALCIAAGVVGYLLAYGNDRLFREGLFQFATAFALPWYAVVGADAAIAADLPILAALALAVITPTAGRYLIEITCGVPPKHFVRSEWFVGTALLSGAIWIGLHEAGLSTWTGAIPAFVAGFVFRLAALYLGWEEPLARGPKGVYRHSDGRPLLGRRLKGKSESELHDLGLLPEASTQDRRP